MAVTKPHISTALSALTTAALCLPGIQAQADVVSNDILGNFSYGYYQESNNRMRVDTYHTDALLPLTERLELSFSVDRDTYSGASPGFSAPATMLNQPQNYHSSPVPGFKPLTTDIVSQASGMASAAMLTSMGLEQFSAYRDNYNAESNQLDAAQKTANFLAYQQTVTDQNTAIQAAYSSELNNIKNYNNLLSSNISLASGNVQNLANIIQSNQAAVDSLDQSRNTATQQYLANNPIKVFDTPSTSISGNPLEFENLAFGAYFGYGNNAPLANGNCPGSGSNGCYSENGVIVSAVYDPTTQTHMHQNSPGLDSIGNPNANNSGKDIESHDDSNGVWIRAKDSGAFDLMSFTLNTSIFASNPNYGTHPTQYTDGNGYVNLQADGSNVAGPHDKWEIYGFNFATNAHLITPTYDGSGNVIAASIPTPIAKQEITNGFVGTVTLNSAFQDVKSVWIFHDGYPVSPQGTSIFPLINYQMQIDHLHIAPYVPPAATADFQNWLTNYDQTTYYHALQQITTDQNAQLIYASQSLSTTLTNLYSDYSHHIAQLVSSDPQIASTTTNSNNLVNAQIGANTSYVNFINSNNANPAVNALTANYNSAVAQAQAQYMSAVNQANSNALTQQNAITAQTTNTDHLAKVYAYTQLLESMVPTGTPTKQVFASQPLETRSQPQFNIRYLMTDSTTMNISGGLSDEPDYISNFGAVNFSHAFNDKQTTLLGGFGLARNNVSRNMMTMDPNAAMLNPIFNLTNYPALNGTNTSNTYNLGFSQIISKNTLWQSTVNYTNQNGFLSNAYKDVYVRGLITPEQYASMSDCYKCFNWSSIPLQVVGAELFRENRPSYRNTWAFSNQINHFLPDQQATVNFNYRLYVDDWGVNSHTFTLKWLQSLGDGWVVTPSIRYYTQTQAFYFAPYYLAPRADNYYSSDYRLSAYGDLSGGINISKTFTRGVKLEAGFEYVTHSGALKLGGNGVGNYADFDYYMAHANLNINLSAKTFALEGSGSNDSHAGHHHHHGPELPAGIMFGHMMDQADDMMIGYRYMDSGQKGDTLHGTTPVHDNATLMAACPNLKSLGVGACNYVPLSMNMHMHMLDLMYAPTDWLNLMAMPQLMTMDMAIGDPLSGMESQSTMFMKMGNTHMTSDKLADTYLTALVKVFENDGHHVHAGIGFSAPTGSIDIKMTGSPPMRMDYSMQTGSGTWDFKPSLTYTGHADDWGWGVQLSGVKHMGKNKYGYALGDLFQATGWGSYQILDWLSASFRSIYTAQDHINGQTSATLESPMIYLTTADPGNYGGRYVDVGFGLSAAAQDGQFANHKLSVEYLHPVLTDNNGYQLDRVGGVAVTWNYAF